jgi:hypothetical protein
VVLNFTPTKWNVFDLTLNGLACKVGLPNPNPPAQIANLLKVAEIYHGICSPKVANLFFFRLKNILFKNIAQLHI